MSVGEANHLARRSLICIIPPYGALQQTDAVTVHKRIEKVNVASTVVSVVSSFRSMVGNGHSLVVGRMGNVSDVNVSVT